MVYLEYIGCRRGFTHAEEDVASSLNMVILLYSPILLCIIFVATLLQFHAF